MLIRSSVWTLSLLTTLVMVQGCGDSGGEGTAGNESFGGPDTSSTDGVDGDGSGDGSGNSDTSGDGDGDGDEEIEVCIPACVTASDCVIGPPESAFDEDNYLCEDGACRYTGCISDAECDLANNGNLVCRAQNGLVPSCVTACTSNAECGNSNDTSGPFGPDNYACDDGGCRFAGCKDDAECQTLGGYVCDTFDEIAYCVLGCVIAEDCVTVDAAAPYDANNYACERGRCTYTGCVSDRECADLGDYTCH